MKLLDNIHSLINRSNNTVNNTKYVDNAQKSNVIDGTFKVVPNLDTEIKELNALCEQCTKNYDAHSKEFAEDKALWNESRTGYTNPYTSPIR